MFTVQLFELAKQNEMDVTTILPILLVLSISCVSVYLFISLIKFIHRVWWNPIHIQNVLASQGIKGPPYKFLHGNTKEISQMLSDSWSKPMENLSHDIFPKLHPHTHSWIKIYGMNFLTWHGFKPQLIVTEPDLVKEILNNRDGVYVKMKVDGYGKKLLGDGLVTTEGQKWVKQRKLANHAFHAQNLKGMVPAMITAVEGMLERWEHHVGEEIQLSQEFRLLTSEIISRTAFGSSYVEGKNIFDMLMKLASLVSANSLKIRFPGIGNFLRTQDDIESDKIEMEIEKLILEIIRRREEKGELEGYGSDYLGLLIKANHEDDESKRISIQDMIDECKTFYFGGHETTTSVLTWTCLLLAIHTDWQDKARKEVIEVLGQSIPTPDDNSISRLKTMNMVINESLRLYPPVLSIIRTVGRDVRLGKLNLQAHIELKISTIAIHHDPQVWGEDVHVFKPERFSEGVVKATNNNTVAFLPFGSGPRTCVGLNFAMTETRIALAMILQRYYFTLSPAYVHSPIQRLTSCQQHGLQIMLHAL